LFINISELLDKAFTRFSHPEIAPIKKLKNGLNIMELFHGTTWAFKDLALSCVGQFLEYGCPRSFSTDLQPHLNTKSKISFYIFFLIRDL
jgi:threonine synthase